MQREGIKSVYEDSNNSEKDDLGIPPTPHLLPPKLVMDVSLDPLEVLHAQTCCIKRYHSFS